MAVARSVFRPIGYYRLQKDSVSDMPARLLAYADAILRGEYPLMGYGSPNLGTNPDWQRDWVSGKTWPLENIRKDSNRSPRRLGRESPLGAFPLAIRAGGG